jgi:hypothetical protein
MEIGIFIEEEGKTDLRNEYQESRYTLFEDYLIYEVRRLRKQVKKLKANELIK